MQKVSKAYKESMKSSLRERAYIMISFGLVNQEAQAKATVDNGSYAYYSNKDNIFGEHIDDTVYATLEEEFTKVDGSMFFLPRDTEGGRYYDTGIVSDKLVSEARCEVIISLNTIATDFKEFLQELLEDIIEIANELGITVNTRKTRICKLSEHWRFLQVQYSLTDTGRVIQKINPKRLTAMRRKMKKLAPKLTEKEFTDFYKSWFKNHYKIMSKKQRSNMDTLFNQLKEVTKCTLSPLPMAKS